MYVLYIANRNYSSWSLRAWLLLHELGAAFEERFEPFEPDGPSAERFGAFSPSATVPCLHHGETVIWDSLAIAEYAAEDFPQVWPADRAARAWARSAAAEMHSGFMALRQQCSMSIGVRVRLHAVNAALQGDIDRLCALWEEGLSRFGGPFLAGKAFTAADAFFAPVVFRVRSYGLELTPEASAYADRLHGLQGMRLWEREALAETLREPGHDREIAARGAVLEDRRAV